jgi:hypothetical protein
MLDCPYCKKPAFPQSQKAWLGPARSIPCESCGKALSVSPRAMLGLLPFLGSFLIAALLFPYAWYASVLVLLAGMIAMFAYHARWVPLVGRESSRERA